jgi:hypothetical protein
VGSDQGTAEAIFESLGQEASLWLLVLAEKGDVGTEAAASYNTYTGAVKSYAKGGEIDLDYGEIRRGFRRLRRVKVELPDGASNTIIIDDDRQDYIKLTNVGYTLQTQLQTRPEVRENLRQKLGMDTDDEEEKEIRQLWPSEIDQEAREIEMYVPSGVPEDTSESFELEVSAEFECNCEWCDNTVRHSYTFVYPDEAWSKTVQTECGECSTKWKHEPGNVYNSPSIAE